MSTFTFEDGVAIAQLIFYLLCLPVTYMVCTRHGMDKALGWYFLLSFSVIRVVGNACQLAAISQGPNSTAEEVALITAFMGTSPLLMASLGLLSRLYTSKDKSYADRTSQPQIIRVIQLVCVVAFILCIIGANQGSLATLYDQTTIKVGVALYIVVWIALTALYLAGAARISRINHERPIKIALVISLPLLLIRVVYSNIRCNADHGPGSLFSDPIKSGTLGLCLGTLPEMATVLTYLWAGLTVTREIPAYQADTNQDVATQNISYQLPTYQTGPSHPQYIEAMMPKDQIHV